MSPPSSNRTALHQSLDSLHGAFCRELDKPGHSKAKREALRAIADQMSTIEPDAFWQSKIALMLDLAFRVLDAAERAVDAQKYDTEKFELMSCLSGLHMHINSLRPREY